MDVSRLALLLVMYNYIDAIKKFVFMHIFSVFLLLFLYYYYSYLFFPNLSDRNTLCYISIL